MHYIKSTSLYLPTTPTNNRAGSIRPTTYTSPQYDQNITLHIDPNVTPLESDRPEDEDEAQLYSMARALTLSLLGHTSTPLSESSAGKPNNIVYPVTPVPPRPSARAVIHDRFRTVWAK